MPLTTKPLGRSSATSAAELVRLSGAVKLHDLPVVDVLIVEMGFRNVASGDWSLSKAFRRWSRQTNDSDSSATVWGLYIITSSRLGHVHSEAQTSFPHWLHQQVF